VLPVPCYLLHFDDSHLNTSEVVHLFVTLNCISLMLSNVSFFSYT
jgi:hypothetical protein